MTVRLPASQFPPQWHTIDLGEGQSLELLVSRPSFEAQIDRFSSQTTDEFHRSRLNGAVRNWRGVTDDAGEAVPYSFDSLLLLIEAYPQALPAIYRLALDVWTTLPEDLEKNLPTPPANGGTATTDETTGTANSSPSTTFSQSDSEPASSSDQI